jgi:hypothetical protein
LEPAEVKRLVIEWAQAVVDQAQTQFGD